MSGSSFVITNIPPQVLKPSSIEIHYIIVKYEVKNMTSVTGNYGSGVSIDSETS